MRRILYILGVCVLLLAVETGAAKNNQKNFLDFSNLWGKNDDAAPASGTNADFTLDTEGSGLDEDVEVDNTHTDDEDFDMEASGDGDDDTEVKVHVTTESPVTDDYYYNNKKGTSDDEDDDLEGSGSGDGIEIDPIVPVTVKTVMVNNNPTTTSKQLTACENLRNTAVQATSVFKPECDTDGEFKKRQCMIDAGNKQKNCWCVDPQGIEITGTRMTGTGMPDCSFGENLSTCVFQLVQNSQGLLGAYKPKCTLEGEYEQIQCQGSECWCVDAVGNEIIGTIKNKPEIPDCPSATTPKAAEKPIIPDKVKPLPEAENPGYDIHDNSKEDISNVVVKIPESEETDVEELEEDTNYVDGSYATMKRGETVLSQPGLLAAIIGGAVVGLLCMVLLVMFVVYRMRKKDEGSYPLDEQKYQNYSYTKAPDKEFYA